MHIREERRGDVRLLRLIGPENRNALSPDGLSAIADALESLDVDPGVGCIVLTGTDEAFAAGADLRWVHAQTHETMLRYAGGAWPRIRAIGAPVVAAVRGWALGGGCELALWCDVVVAGESARFGLPEVSLGLVPGAGGTQILARTAGRQFASELIFTGRRFTAQEAAGLGLVNRITRDEDCLDEALTLAGEIAGKPRLAVRLAKRALRAAEEQPLEGALDYERRLFELAFSTEERRAATAEFLSR
jgi:enoyl-CoA hydratase